MNINMNVRWTVNNTCLVILFSSGFYRSAFRITDHFQSLSLPGKYSCHDQSTFSDIYVIKIRLIPN